MQECARRAEEEVWAEVLEATKEADALEVMLASIQAEVTVAEEETRYVEAAEKQEELKLTMCSADALKEYTVKQEEVLRLESELSVLTQMTTETRASNLRLSAKNIELDHKDGEIQETLAKEMETVKKSIAAQGGLDADLVRQIGECDRLRAIACCQAERFALERHRLETSRSRLLDICKQPSPEIESLLVETDEFLAQMGDALSASTEVAKYGIRIREPVNKCE